MSGRKGYRVREAETYRQRAQGRGFAVVAFGQSVLHRTERTQTQRIFHYHVSSEAIHETQPTQEQSCVMQRTSEMCDERSEAFVEGAKAFLFVDHRNGVDQTWRRQHYAQVER